MGICLMCDDCGKNLGDFAHVYKGKELCQKCYQKRALADIKKANEERIAKAKEQNVHPLITGDVGTGMSWNALTQSNAIADNIARCTGQKTITTVHQSKEVDRPKYTYKPMHTKRQNKKSE